LFNLCSKNVQILLRVFVLCILTIYIFDYIVYGVQFLFNLCSKNVQILLRVFVLCILTIYIFDYIVYGVQFLFNLCSKSVQILFKKCSKNVQFLKNWTLHMGYPMGEVFWQKNEQSTFNFLSSILVIIDKNGQSNFLFKNRKVIL
jgi:hypothetical protein